MNEKNRVCLAQLLNFSQQELSDIKIQMEDTLEHLVRGETLAALGSWDGLERRLTFAGTALQLIAKLYPTGSRLGKADKHKSN